MREGGEKGRGKEGRKEGGGQDKEVDGVQSNLLLCCACVQFNSTVV